MDIGLVDIGLVDIGLVDIGLVDIGLVDIGLVDIGLVDFSHAMKERYTFALLAKTSARTKPTFSNERIATHVLEPSIKRSITHNA